MSAGRETRASSQIQCSPQAPRAVWRHADRTGCIPWRLPMRALIWKEWREHLKWVPLPGLVILLVFLIDRPDEPMPDFTEAFFFGLTAVGFAAALGFLQVFFEAHGDKRSLLLHRPMDRS